MKKIINIIIVVIALVSTQLATAQTQEQDAIIIELVQTSNQFETTVLNLKPGKYQFRIVNKNVDKDLGFVIQKEKDKKSDVMKTAIPNSFTTSYVKKGKAEYTGVVELKEGKYVYSCPLNPTPHYIINVN